MTTYLFRRLLYIIPFLFVVVSCAALLIRMIPGSPARRILGEYATEEAVAKLEHELGLDKPVLNQLLDFLYNFIRGNLGTSLRNRRPVFLEIIKDLPYTVELAIAGTIVSVLIGVPAGSIAAIFPNSFWDASCRIIALIGLSFPIFWIGLLMIYFFSVRLQWFPSVGGGTHQNVAHLLRCLVLPAVTVGGNGAALIMRITRSSMLEVLREDYVRTAYSKGVPPYRVYMQHALKNASLPIVTVIGLNFGYLLGGAVVTETVFSRPGIGKLFVDAVLWRDYPIVQGVIVFFALGVASVNLVVDLLYAILDPRIRLE